MTFADIINEINSIVWGWPMIILLIGTHIFLTIRLKFPQRKIFTAIKLSFKPDQGCAGEMSQFGALATSLAASIGTGNIIGVATAVSLGGPGAVFWCLMTGLLGIATKYGEGLLAVKYRTKNKNGEIVGGPMYALERGLNMKWLAILFAIFTACAAFGIGNIVQAKAISDILVPFCPLENETMSRFIIGITMALIVGLVVVGGVKKISKVCSSLVPFMAIIYILGCVFILYMNHNFLWSAIYLIVSDAFSLKASIGGVVGTAIMTSMRYGLARGLFSNEAGLGSSPIIAAAAKTKNPVRQALVLSSGVFWDSVVICTLTGLVIVSSILAFDNIDISSSGILTHLAFGKIPYIGTPLLSIGIITFAFSTILGWTYCGEKAIEYLFGGKIFIQIYRSLWIIGVIVGSCMNFSTVWNLADIMNGLMAIPNLISLLLLSGVIVKETRHYLWENHLDEEAEDLRK